MLAIMSVPGIAAFGSGDVGLEDLPATLKTPWYHYTWDSGCYESQTALAQAVIASHANWYTCSEVYNGANPDYPANPLAGRAVAVPYCPTPKGYNVTNQYSKPIVRQNAQSSFSRYSRTPPGYTCPGNRYDYDIITTRESFEYCPTGYDIWSINGTANPAAFFCKRLAPVEDRCELYAGNPLSLGTGQKHQVEDDYRDNRNGHLTLQRHHVSARWGEPGLFGANWHTLFDRAISYHGASPALASVRRENGIKRHFIRQADGSWKSNLAIDDVLRETPTGWTYTTPEPATETYDTNGRLLSVSYLDGTVLTLTWNGTVPDNVRSSTGESLFFFEDPVDGDTLVDAVTDDAGRVWKYTYDLNSNLASVIRPDGTPGDDSDNPVRQYVYEDSNFRYALTGIVDERGVRYATFGYSNAAGLEGTVVSSFHGDSTGPAETVSINTHNDTYLGDGTIVRTVTNSKGLDTVYTVIDVNGVALPAGIAGPGCATCASGNTAYTYHPGTTDLWEKTENGVTTEYGDYDANGNAGYRIEARGTPAERRTDYTYDTRYFSRIATITGPSVFAGGKKVTTYRYDDYGNRTAEIIHGFRPDGTPVSRSTLREYHGPLHQLSRIDGPRTDVSDITTLRYYPDDPGEGSNRARLKEIDDANGVLVRGNIRYTATGRVASEDRPNGLTLVYTYYPGNDRLETLVEDSASGVRVTRWTYLATGEVRSITTADGTPAAATVTFGYDAARRLVRVTDGLGNYIDYTLDSEGNRTAGQIYDSAGILRQALASTFDSYNRLDLSRAGTSPASPLEQVDTDYSADGTLDRITDGNGSITDYSYDALKRLLSTTQDLGGTDPATANALTRYGYDIADRLTAVTDPNNGTTTYQYDDLGNLLSTTSPDTGTTTWTHDAAGNVLSKTTASGTPEAITLTYSYDTLNRLTAVTTPDPQKDVAHTHDSCPNGSGRLCRITNGSASVFYRYDGFGNVAAHQGVTYTHDAASRIRTITYPSGALLTYTHDLAGQVTGVVLTVNGQARSLASGIAHAPFGGIEALTYGNGRTLTQTRDSAYRLTTQTVPGILGLGYTVYDLNGNLIQRDDSLGSTSSFGYDPLNRLYSASGPFGTGWGYDYDRNGNRILTDEGSPVTLGYEPDSNRLDRIGNSDVVLGTSGQTLAKGNWNYGYTLHQRLADASDNGTLVASFGYNGLGQRVHKVRPDGTGAAFFYGPDGRLQVETDLAGNVLVEYVYIDGRLLAIYLPDTDRDGLTNRVEAALGSGPASPDDDGDGLGNLDELLTYGTLINNPDTDGDGVSDGAEVANGTDPGHPGSVSLPGDINSDGQVDVADYLILGQYVLDMKIPAAAEQAAADLNQDGQLDAGDLVILSRIILGLVWQHVIDSGVSRSLLAVREGLVGTAEATVTQGELYFVHTDHLGTPQVMTDEAGSVVWRATYDPFGKATLNVNTVELNVRFPGQYFDRETGLHYNYFRYYDPGTGRYLNADPIGQAGGVNLYSYVGNNPINWADPLGLAKICRRALEGFPGKVGPLHHSQILYDDGTDSGFFDDDTIRPDKNHNRSEYSCDGPQLDDNKVKQAEKEVQKTWDMDWRMPLFGGWNNCQDYTDAVLERLAPPVQYMQTRRGRRRQ